MKILSKIKNTLKKIGHAFLGCFGKVENGVLDMLISEQSVIKLVGEHYAVDIQDDNVSVTYGDHTVYSQH